MAKKGTKQCKYSPEFKLSVIMDMRENHISYSDTMRKYFPTLGIKNFSFLKKWERVYLEEGPAGLAIERRGRASKMEGVRKGRKPKVKPEIKDDLIAENQRLKERLEYLEAENEYLKKLDALIREEEARKAARRKQ